MSLTSFLYVIAVICPVSTQVINPTKEVIIFAFDSHVYKEIKRKQKKKMSLLIYPVMYLFQCSLFISKAVVDIW